MTAVCVYEIRVAGHLPERWSEWFAGLTICPAADGETTLTGALADQAALLGVLGKMHALNLTVIAVTKIPAGDE